MALKLTHAEARARVKRLREMGVDLGKRLDFQERQEHVHAAAVTISALVTVRNSTNTSYVEIQALIDGFMEGANVEAVSDRMGGERFRAIERAPRPME